MKKQKKCKTHYFYVNYKRMS